MKHLTVEQIVEFVSLTTINDKAVALSAAVNGHIRHCGRCFDKVCAFQAIHDEFYFWSSREALKTISFKRSFQNRKRSCMKADKFI